jgi:transcriptional regulator with XRE-family HTH domain
MAKLHGDDRLRRLPRPRGAAAGMFKHFGPTLALLRNLRSKSQGQIARETGIGKSQLSKYENGRELPKLESLGRLLQTLDVTLLGFAYTLALVQHRAQQLAPGAARAAIEEPMLLLAGQGLLAEPLDNALGGLVRDLTRLHRHCLETVLFKETP